MSNDFFFNYAKTKYDLSPEKAQIHEQAIKGTMGYALAVAERAFKDTAEHYATVFREASKEIFKK
jgi:hypothetical protein